MITSNRTSDTIIVTEYNLGEDEISFLVPFLYKSSTELVVICTMSVTGFISEIIQEN